MAQELFEGSEILNPEAISKEEDFSPESSFLWEGPRCEVCGRHINFLKPFGGPGDPLDADFSGELLVMRWRPLRTHDEAMEKAVQEADESFPGNVDRIPWLISKFGEKKAHDIYLYCQASDTDQSSWECRDCIGLSDDEYFEAIHKTRPNGWPRWMSRKR